MIVLKIQGGLGNQLFQYAAGRAISIANNVELVLDLSWFDNQIRINTKRLYELDAYKISGRFAQGNEVFWCRIHQNRILSRLSFLHGKWKHVKDNNQVFDDRIFSNLSGLYLDGYWQSYRYFNQVADLLRKELTPIAHPSPADSALIERITDPNSVSVHVRRGDYVTNPRASNFHGLCSAEYYEMAMSCIEGVISFPHYFVFSDDIDWAKDNIRFKSKVTFVESRDVRNPVEDLRLMSMCKHNIIANSSFSWWGAWLNDNPDKLVIAPKKWFVSQPTESLIPSSWIVL
jgi:hypothetical protein